MFAFPYHIQPHDSPGLSYVVDSDPASILLNQCMDSISLYGLRTLSSDTYTSSQRVYVCCPRTIYLDGPCVGTLAGSLVCLCVTQL
jgi:hypothetical protein